MLFGKLDFQPAKDHLELLGEPTRAAFEKLDPQQRTDVLVAEIDPALSDTAAFCEQYETKPELAVNCVIIEAKRADRIWYAACMIPGAKRADINGIVRRELDARKVSFAPQETAVKLTGMEYGAINPLGLPADWPILVDTDAAALEHALIGSGVRKSKLLVPGKLLAELPGAKVMDLGNI